MAALARSRDTLMEGPVRTISVKLKANAVVYAGGIVCVDSTGYGVAASTATGLIAMGIAKQGGDNTGGASGDVIIDVLCSVGCFGNSSAGDAIAQAQVGSSVYLVDDQTLAKTDGTGTRSAAGKVVRVDSSGVWAYIGVL